MKRKTYYQLEVDSDARTADINIYGAITSAAEIYEKYGISRGEVSAHGLKQVIDGLDVDVINVYINSYGGEVAEALAIYSALRRHKAKIKTFCDGFACSAATIVFCAGEERTMGRIALMMIHNCMSYIGYANSEELRKAAEDNDKVNQSSIEAYKRVTGGKLTEDQIKEMMTAETWMSAEESLEYGFATAIDDDEDDDEDDRVQSAFASIRSSIRQGHGGEELPAGAVSSTLEDIRRTLQEIRERQGAIAVSVLELGVGKEGKPAVESSAEGEPADEPAAEGAGAAPETVNKAKRFFGILAGK